MRVTQPFDASTWLSIDRELVERPAEMPFGFTQGHELVEWQMDIFRQAHKVTRYVNSYPHVESNFSWFDHFLPLFLAPPWRWKTKYMNFI